ncbi:MAG: hypothetical protein MJ060_04135 [Clostridia bacterium]|nr:hypothetical protein [Clostridia bacterium]
MLIPPLKPRQAKEALIRLFKVLNQDPAKGERDPYLATEYPILAKFPYINGGLFKDADIEIPPFTQEIVDLLLVDCARGFDWSQISPTIFGAVFESTLNPQTRREGGMHYTSIENIHKVIDPLFLDDLRAEFETIKTKNQRALLTAFQDKLASLTFFDPACGSGNFLTETYLCLRQLENEVIELLNKIYVDKKLKRFQDSEQNRLAIAISPVKVSITQFYGIEINDFAVDVARAALWIAKTQMLKRTEDITQEQYEFLPLTTNGNIIEGNALRIDWNDILPAEKCDYIMGNPPFVGAMIMSREQKEEMANIFNGVRGFGELDYVAAWYKRACDYMQNYNIFSAFVSTNSICQGQQAAMLWEPLFKENLIINFAYKTFRWDSEASLKAHVHCIIIGFSKNNSLQHKFIYENDSKKQATAINQFLADAPIVFIKNQSNPVCKAPDMAFGSMPRDGGFFTITADELDALKKENNVALKFIKPYIGAQEFINNKKRYCLWLVDASPQDIRQNAFIYDRVTSVRDFRLESKAKATQKFAETPHLFCQIAQPDSDCSHRIFAKRYNCLRRCANYP